MPLYSYQGRDSTGQMIEGKQIAEGLEQLVYKLQKDNLLILDIKEIKVKKRFFSSKKIRLQDLSLLCRQLSFMLGAGISLAIALGIIIQNENKASIKNMAQTLLKDLSAGLSFSQACAQYPQKLPPMLIDMVASAEIGGFLAESLERVAYNLEKEVDLKEKLKTALLYPMIVLFTAILGLAIIFIFVIPVFGDILHDMKAPIPLGTQLILKLSLIFREFWLFFIVGFIFVIILLIIYGNSSQGRKNLENIYLKIPVFKVIYLKTTIAGFCRMVANLLQSGVPLLKALDVVSKSIDNITFKDQIIKSQRSIENGSSLAESFKDSFFPPIIIQMMAVGEQSGNLDQLLFKASDYYEKEVAELSERFPKLIEPIVIIILGIVVGGIVLGVLLPMFEVMNSIGT